MTELKKCPLCENAGEIYRKLVRCSDLECFLHYTRMPIDEWQSRPIEEALEVALNDMTKRHDRLLPLITFNDKERIRLEIENTRLDGEISSLRASVKEAVKEMKQDIDLHSERNPLSGCYGVGLNQAIRILREHGLLEEE